MVIGKKGASALTSNNALIQAAALGYRRHRRFVLQDISFVVKKGQALWIQGPNGSGKSTLLKILTGVISGYQGSLNISAPVCYIGHQPAIPSLFSVTEILRYYERIYGQKSPKPFEVILEKWGLKNLSGHPFFSLSAGQKKRLDLARIDFCDKQLWLLDEPCTHLDAQASDLFFHAISQHCHQGGGVCIVHHGDIPSKQKNFSTCLTLGGESSWKKSKRYYG